MYILPKSIWSMKHLCTWYMQTAHSSTLPFSYNTSMSNLNVVQGSFPQPLVGSLQPNLLHDSFLKVESVTYLKSVEADLEANKMYMKCEEELVSNWRLKYHQVPLKEKLSQAESTNWKRNPLDVVRVATNFIKGDNATSERRWQFFYLVMDFGPKRTSTFF